LHLLSRKQFKFFGTACFDAFSAIFAVHLNFKLSRVADKKILYENFKQSADGRYGIDIKNVLSSTLEFIIDCH